MNYRLYFESRKGRLLQIAAAVAAVILFFISVSHFQTGSTNKRTTHTPNIYLEEYGCGVHVEVRVGPQKIHKFKFFYSPPSAHLFSLSHTHTTN
jgi:hypothetical protein